MEEDQNHNSGLVRSNSNDSDNVADIIKNVEDLFVEENIPTRPQAKELIQKLIQDFTEYNTTFLKEYLDVLENSNPSAVTEVTNNIVFTIESVLEQHLKNNQKWQESVLVVLLGWMCVTVLCLVDPHVQSPYRALREMLLHTTIKERVRLASAFWRHLSPALLIELADATTRPKSQPGLNQKSSEPEATLSDLLLRATLCRLQPELQQPQWQSGPLLVEEAAAGISSAWADADVNGRFLLVQVAARTRSERALFEVAKGRHETGRPEALKVSVEIAKLRLLFQDKTRQDNKNERFTIRSNKRKRREE